MKSFKLLFLGLFVFCFTGCFEVNEEINITNNGSGDYAVSMDMSKMMDMMQAFIPPDQAKDLEKVKDTTIQMKDLLDTVTTLTPEKKALLREGSLHLQMNMAEKIFKMNMKYPFKNTGDLQRLYGSLGEAGSGMGSMLGGLNPGGPAPGGAQPDMKMISSYFDLETKKNSISRKLNKEKYATLADDQMMQQLKQAGEMGGGGAAMMGGGMGEIKMNTTIKLPAPAKSIKGSKAELSSDKRIVIIKNGFMDIFSHPENFEFTVEY